MLNFSKNNLDQLFYEMKNNGLLINKIEGDKSIATKCKGPYKIAFSVKTVRGIYLRSFACETCKGLHYLSKIPTKRLGLNLHCRPKLLKEENRPVNSPVDLRNRLLYSQYSRVTTSQLHSKQLPYLPPRKRKRPDMINKNGCCYSA